MKKIVFFVIFMSIIPVGNAGQDVNDRAIHYVYQPNIDSKEFEFSANRENGCGTTLYRVKSENETIANRKFSIVLLAFSAEKKVDFHDTGVCEGNRSVVTWVRVKN